MTAFEVKQMLARGVGSVIDLDGRIGAGRHRYIMAYHRVISAEEAAADGVYGSLWITPASFETHLRWMLEVGEIVDIETLMDFSRPNGRPWFALTFDDGWIDTYSAAFPIMKRLGVPATVFLVSGAMDDDALFWPQDIATKTQRALREGGREAVVTALRAEGRPLTAEAASAVTRAVDAWIEALKLIPRPRRDELVARYFRSINSDERPLTGYLMSWGQAQEMTQHGIRMGSHTHTHAILEELTLDEALEECAVSKGVIERRLEQHVSTFCYPNARFCGDEGAFLSRLGYDYAFRLDGRCASASSDRYFVPRFLVSEAPLSVPSYFKLHLLGVPLYQTRPHVPHPRQTTRCSV